MTMKKVIRCLLLVSLVMLSASGVFAAPPFGEGEVKNVPQGVVVKPAPGPGVPEVLPEGYVEAMAFNKGRQCGAFYKPVAEWTGRLILPAALRIEPTTTVIGRAEIKQYLAEKEFAGLQPDVTRQTLWLSGSGSESGSSDILGLWPVGTRGLLIHVFGWRKSPREGKNGGVILGLVTGHFAFGEAQVVKCPFTGELRWDIEYFQIYVHNPNGIISCTQKWHAYMGNLRRGWMFTVPVSDTIVQLPGQGKFEAVGRNDLPSER